MTSNPVDIIIPTYNNSQQLMACLTSLIKNHTAQNLYKIIVVNNGHPDSCDWIKNDIVTVINAPDNRGWEGGLKIGLAHSTSPFVMFLNDDTLIPMSSRTWMNQLLQHFINPSCAAVGPSSNVVMGMQNIFCETPYTIFPVRFLIGFCVLLRRSAFDEVGGVDDTLPGGDDLDFSIRLRQAGYRLFCNKEVFVYHHGFQTGTRVHGGVEKNGGWNSYDMYSETNTALIRKHGFKLWWECQQGVYLMDEIAKQETEAWEDSEGKLIASKATGEVILDVGCGGNKTLPNVIGIDMVPTDTIVETLVGGPKSQADVVADVSQPLPYEDGTVDCVIARHILEHLVDTVGVLKNWTKILKPGGQLIIAVPDEDKIKSIPMNIEHKHAFNRVYLKELLELIGMRVLEQLDPQNGISFITIAEKV